MIRQNKNFILFGGIPRSGTTLTCHLFNQYPDTHALIESMNVSALVKLNSDAERLAFINNYMSTVYSSIKNSQPVDINVIDSQDTNTFSEKACLQLDKRKSKIISKQPSLITQKLNEDFKLILKHPNAFIALLPELKKTFRIFAQIRNPLSILASWNSLDHALSRGHAPMAEAINKDLKTQLANISDCLDRQIASAQAPAEVFELNYHLALRPSLIEASNQVTQFLIFQGFGKMTLLVVIGARSPLVQAETDG